MDIGAGPDTNFSLFRITIGKLWLCLYCLFDQEWLLFSYIALSTIFLSLKIKKILHLALEQVEILLSTCDSMPNIYTAGLVQFSTENPRILATVSLHDRSRGL